MGRGGRQGVCCGAGAGDGVEGVGEGAGVGIGTGVGGPGLMLVQPTSPTAIARMRLAIIGISLMPSGCLFMFDLSRLPLFSCIPLYLFRLLPTISVPCPRYTTFHLTSIELA